MHASFKRDLPSPLVDCEAITYVKKIFIKNNCLSKNTVSLSISGPSTLVSTRDRPHHLPSCIHTRGPLTAATSGPVYIDVMANANSRYSDKLSLYRLI